MPLALGETWWGVLGGLIPIVGLTMFGLVLWHAAKPPEEKKPFEGSDDAPPPT